MRPKLKESLIFILPSQFPPPPLNPIELGVDPFRQGYSCSGGRTTPHFPVGVGGKGGAEFLKVGVSCHNDPRSSIQ